MLEAIQGFYEFNSWACTSMVLGTVALFGVVLVYMAGLIEEVIYTLIEASKED